MNRPPAGWPVDQQISRIVQNKYRIDRRLSSGGFGTVFLAMQVHGGIEMGRVILKFLHPEHAADPRITKRFLTEAQTARELINPHIVRVFDIGYDDDGTPFMVQEYIEGEGLDEILEREVRLTPPRALRVAIQVAEGMAEAHRKEIIHRDLKPENLRIQKGTTIIKILDFGIARVSRGTDTATNSFIGTPRYMPPEQIKQQKLDNGIDVFALGVMLFEMIAGEPPIPRDQSELEYIHLNLLQMPRKLIDLVDDCPPELSEFVDSMMAKERSERPPDMETVSATLLEIADRYGWTEETTGRFRISAPSSPSRSKIPSVPSQRTPAPATGEEEVVELVLATPSRTGLWVGLFGAVAVTVLAFVLLIGRGGSGAGGGAGSPGNPPAPVGPADDAVPGVPDIASKPEGDEAPPPAEDAAASVKIEDVVPDAGVEPPVVVDAGVVEPAQDAVAVRPQDTGPIRPREAGIRPPRDFAGASERDIGQPPPRETVTAPPTGDAGGSERRDVNPFQKVGGSLAAP